MPKVKVPTAVAPYPPTESEMATALGEAYPAFQALVRRAGVGAAEWRRYNEKSPWVLKVTQGKRSLFYARPDSGHLMVTVLLGGRAVEAALAGQVSRRLHPSIRKAKVYPEGRPVSVVVRRASDIAGVEELIAVKLEATARQGKSKTTPPGGRVIGQGPRRRNTTG